MSRPIPSVYCHLRRWWSTRSLLVISRASTHIYLYGLVQGGVVPSHNGENADFGSVFHINNARKSLSLLGVSKCSRPPLDNQVRLETYGRVDHAIGLGHSFRLRSWPLLDWSPSVATSCCTCARFRLWDFLAWSSMTTHLESYYTRLRLACWWRPDSFFVRVHAGLGARWLCCHSKVGWALLKLWRFCTPAHYRVGLCRLFEENSLKTTRCSGLREMWHRNPTTLYVLLAQCSGLLQSLSPLVHRFLRIGCQQHRLGCLLENGSSQNVPYSAQIVDRSPSSWSTSILSTKSEENTWSTIPRLRPLSVFLMSWSTWILTRSLGLFSRTVELIYRLVQVVCFCRIIDGNAHRFSPNVLYEDLADCFVQVQLRAAFGECRVE